MQHKIILQTDQHKLIKSVLQSALARGEGKIYSNKGVFERNYYYDFTKDFDKIKSNINKKNNQIIALLTDNDIDLLTMYLHDVESDLVSNNGYPKANESQLIKLRFVCKTIDYLDSFLPEEAFSFPWQNT